MPNPYRQFLLDQVDRSKVFQRFVERGLENDEYALFHGLEGGARALVVARLQQRLARPVLVVAADAETAEGWYDDLQHFGVEGLEYFPMGETLPYEAEEPVVEIVARQFSTLHYLSRGEHADLIKAPVESSTDIPVCGSSLPSSQTTQAGMPVLPSMQDAHATPLPLIVAPIEALHRRLPSREDFDRLVLRLWWGEKFDVEAVSRRLVEMGYERQSMTEVRGEFSIRGHIVDIFPPHLENPARFDLFGDEIESIRFFDASTQRSIQGGDEIERVTILPARIQSICDRLAREGRPLAALADHFPENTLVVLDAPEKFDRALDPLERIALRRHEELTGRKPLADAPEIASPESDTRFALDGEPLPPALLYLASREIQRALERFAQILLPQVEIKDQAPETSGASIVRGFQPASDAGPRPAPQPGRAVFDFRATSFETIPPDLETYISLIRQKQKSDFSIHVVCDNDGQAMRLEELLGEKEIGARRLDAASDSARFIGRDLLSGYQDVILLTGPLHGGFIFPEAQLLIVTDREMFGRYKRRHVYRKAYKGKPILSVGEIRRNDYVVHSDHGIGRFAGIRKQEIDGRETEFLEIEYADGGKLLVPIENVGRVQKYSSVEGAVPTVDRLGGKRWQTRKKKSQEAIEQMAEELLEIYAQRKIDAGHAFPPDTVWIREFEDSFVYEETPDQLRAIDEVKKDMASARPMDRLLCGDVGFGKTEVAMRAAFKCVEDKKQVAVLVPTTILAQQHYTTFKERFAEYPFRIDVLSRFRTEMEQREVVNRLKTGELDLVIGTHRLISADVQFADLGLLVVDEEHRFGVRQKEKIKALRAAVDVLTLSATPIPRTLHLALSGLRDMSTINTPPRDRLPIRTRVIRFVPEEIEEAILRELNRGGQIYFVHNRVQSIDRVAKRLHEIVPRARIAIGHGQMHERDLERVMFDFIDRKYDILLSTTIIESGLDIPNVNTIVINRADAFGLAQLYQLRGRVGRDVRRAYAYLIVPDGRAITDAAVKRLRAIEEFTELGMGFQVAMRDLEIRGTGNILGSEQHGAIEAVGFELYCQLLEETVRRLQGKGRAQDYTVEIRWSLAAFLPEPYVPVESQRVAFYKRCSNAREARELEDLTAELRDRYGSLPAAAKNLIAISLMRLLAREAGVQRIVLAPSGFKLVPRGDVFDFLRRARSLKNREPQDHVPQVQARQTKNLLKNLKSVAPDSAGGILFEIRPWDPEKGIETAIALLRALAEAD